jgi:hypothetical protein
LSRAPEREFREEQAMEHPTKPGPETRRTRGESLHPGRRAFLKASSLAAIAATGVPAMGWLTPRPVHAEGIRGNGMPGRIVILHEPAMGGHLAAINKARVAITVHQGIRLLTGQPTTAAAYESLFPGLTATSKIAIKVNCIGPTDTRWETARAVVEGLSMMLGGTYNVANVTVYDNQDIFGHGYSTAEFTFNGHAAVLSSSNNPGSYYVYQSYRLSNYLLNANYVIDIPVIKSHNDGNNQITVALKNHYGSCSPSSLCGNIAGMLTVNADANIKNKTCLVITDAIRGTYTGDPGQPPQLWNTFTEQTPNTLFFGTDPITNDYWARDMINDERQTHGWSAKPCPWIEQGSGAPYSLGISDPAQMTVLRYEASDVEEPSGSIGDTTFFAPNVPNPFGESTTIRFRLGRAGSAALQIVAADGRMIRDLGRRDRPAGSAELSWDRRNNRGQRVVAGVYFARLQTANRVLTHRMVVID